MLELKLEFGRELSSIELQKKAVVEVADRTSRPERKHERLISAV